MTTELGTLVTMIERNLGSDLTAAAATGATTLAVTDVADFLAAGESGTVLLNGQQLVFTAVDDDASTLKLTAGLPAAGDEGDRVDIYDTKAGKVPVEYLAKVVVEGEDFNGEAITCSIRQALLPFLKNIEVDADGIPVEVRWEDDGDAVVIDILGDQDENGLAFYQDQLMVAVAGAQPLRLTYLPDEHSEHLYINGVEYDETDGWSRDERTINLGAELIRVGDKVKVEYAYLKGAVSAAAPQVIIPWDSSGWRYLPNINDAVDRSAPGFDDSSWSIGAMPRTWNAGNSLKLWARKTFPAATQCILHIDVEDHANVYVNGVKVAALPFKGAGIAHDDRTIDYAIPESALVRGTNMLAIEAIDDTASRTYLNIELQGVLL